MQDATDYAFIKFFKNGNSWIHKIKNKIQIYYTLLPNVYIIFIQRQFSACLGLP